MQPDDFLYEAERVLHIRRMPSKISDPQEYFDHVVGTRWFGARWENVRKREVKVVACEYASAWGDISKNKIYLPRWAMNDFTLLHEIAHFCEWEPLDHGPKFAQAEISLVSRFMGKEAGSALRHSMIACGVDIG